MKQAHQEFFKNGPTSWMQWEVGIWGYLSLILRDSRKCSCARCDELTCGKVRKAEYASSWGVGWNRMSLIGCSALWVQWYWRVHKVWEYTGYLKLCAGAPSQHIPCVLSHSAPTLQKGQVWAREETHHEQTLMLRRQFVSLRWHREYEAKCVRLCGLCLSHHSAVSTWCDLCSMSLGQFRQSSLKLFCLAIPLGTQHSFLLM